MLYYNKVKVSEGIDANKTSESKECDICHCWYFLSKRFNFQSYVCNRCHNFIKISLNLSDIAILNNYFDGIMRVIDIDFDNTLLDEKSYQTYENILIMTFHTKLSWVKNHCVLG